MATPQDKQRTTAFRAWLKHIGHIAAAQRHTGIALRTLERMRSGKQPPPVRLLEDLAATVTDPALAAQLRDAASAPMEATNA